MNSKIVAVVIGLVLLVALLGFSMTYSVRFSEVAIVTTFGKATTIQSSPGLHFKWPVPIQSATKYDSRLQTVDTRMETHATSDGLQVIAQAFVLWRIDPERVLDFNGHFGSIEAASSAIESRMRSAGGAISEFEFAELIGRDNNLPEVEDRITQRLTAAGADSRSLAELGVRIEDVGLSQILLPVETTKKVVERMKKEKDEAAERIRSESNAFAQGIRSDGQRMAQVILDHADRVANRIRAEGDALSRVSVAKLNEDPAFAQFLFWLDALEKSTGGATTFFMPVNIAPFHLFDPERIGTPGIPQPDVMPIGGMRAVPRNTPAGATADGDETTADS